MEKSEGTLEMMIRVGTIILPLLVCCSAGFALEPEEILVIANSDIAASVRTAQYYCAKRGVPAANILALPLGTNLSDTITRAKGPPNNAATRQKKGLILR